MVKRKKPTSTWGKIWYFIWHEDSLASWIANIIIAFLLVRFIIYPVLGALLGTGLPVVAVVSESMDHDYTKDACVKNWKLCGDIQQNKPQDYNKNEYWNYCGEWYEKRNISEESFKDFKLSTGFSKGDIIVLTGKKVENIAIGDVIVFQSQKQYPIIHRVVNIEHDAKGYVFATKGDHNPTQIISPYLDETKVEEQQILGVARAKVPLLGWVKIGFVNLLGQGRSCP